MDVREELHAVLEELSSDELPDPEVLRRALRGTWPVSRNALLHMPAVGLEGSLLALLDSDCRLTGFAPGGDARRIRMFAAVPGEAADLELHELHGRTWVRAVEALVPGTFVRSGLEGAPEPTRSSFSGEPSSPHDVPGAEQEPKKPRRMPRSAGMGTGPADLSQREGFGPPEDGEAG